MSLKTLIKRIFRTADANISYGLDKLNSTEKRLMQAARTISDEIHRLEEARQAVIRQIAHSNSEAKKNLQMANDRESVLKEAVARGATPSRTEAMVVLHRRRVGEALLARREELNETVTKLNSAIIELGDRFEEVTGNLELIKIQKETEDLGLSLPEDVEYASQMVNIDVDSMLRDIQISGKSDLNAKASSLEVDNYLSGLKE